MGCVYPYIDGLLVVYTCTVSGVDLNVQASCLCDSVMRIIRYRPSIIKLLTVEYMYGTLANEPTCSELVGSIKTGDDRRRCLISQKVTIDKHYFLTNCLTDVH
jgi:hypothetical protein